MLMHYVLHLGENVTLCIPRVGSIKCQYHIYGTQKFVSSLIHLCMETKIVMYCKIASDQYDVK